MFEEEVEVAGDASGPPLADRPTASTRTAVCPVIGLGASAGGLEAFESFLTVTSPEAGLACPFAEPLAFAAASLEQRDAQRPAERADPAMRRVMERYAPPHVVVNAAGAIVRSSARTSRYLELAEGAPSNRVVDLAKRGLRSAVRSALEGVRQTRRCTIVRGVRFEGDAERIYRVDVCADPLSEDETLLLFLNAGDARGEAGAVPGMYEELATVNEELKNKVDQLARANADLRQAQADVARNEDLARQRSDEIETLYRTAPVAMAMVDRNRRFLRINRHFAELTGQGIEELRGRLLQDTLPMLAHRMEAPIDEVFAQAREVVNLDATVRAGGDAARDFLMDFYPYEVDGRVAAVGVILKDVTELRRLEKELRRLMDELQHRVKNTLATVTSIVNQTVASKHDRAELVDILKKRIAALAATHNLLTLQDWRDASLQDILDAELMPYGASERVRWSGPMVRLPPKHALTLTLTFHELATNAAKYGALAHEGGTLSIDWTVSVEGGRRRLTLDWRERGVPGIAPTPVRQSFGTRLIRSAVVHDLKGRCDYRLEPGGLSCTLSMPF